MCGVEKGNWYRMKTIHKKCKLRGRLYAVTLVLTLAIIPSCSWAFIQQIWYSNGWQTVTVELIQIFQKVHLGSFQAKGLSSYLAHILCHAINQYNVRCIALRQVICDPCAVLNVSWQTDWGAADCECGKLCMVVYITTFGTHQLNYFIPLTKRLQDEFSFLENSDFNF